MDANLRKQLRELIDREVVLATGCTEPGAVALCVSKACSLLGHDADGEGLSGINVKMSKNVYKNAMGVGIPGTGMIGLPIAVAMAVTHGDPERGLEVLQQKPEEVDDAKRWLANNNGKMALGVKNTDDKLYIECTVASGDHRATAIIAGRHTNFVFLSHDDKALLDNRAAMRPRDTAESDAPKLELTARMVFDYATTAPIEELRFINATVERNGAASEEGRQGMGLHTGEILLANAGDDIVHLMVAKTVAASDARMDGCTKPIYSNSGSGNQGITCTLPPYYYGTMRGCSDEQITRALILSHLMSIYIKQGIGRLSALCGIVNATIGVSAALVYLNGGTFEQVGYAIKDMINTIAGMVCDGAKPSCALKMSAGLYSAYVCSTLAMHNRVVEPTDGLSERCVDNSIRNLGRLGHDGMNETDDVILDIMTHKKD